MQRIITILLTVSLLFIAGCKDDVTTPTKTPTPKKTATPPESTKFALLIIDNFTAYEYAIFDNTVNPPKELIKLAPFKINQIQIQVNSLSLEAKSDEKPDPIKLSKDLDTVAIYLWDLSATCQYESLQISPKDVKNDATYKDADDGFYQTNARMSMLEPMRQLDSTVIRLFKAMPDNIPMTLDYAKKIAYEMPHAFTFSALERVVKTIAGDLKGSELEKEILPLFGSGLPALVVPAADILAERGSRELGLKFMQMIDEGWLRTQSVLKKLKVVQIIAGCLGVEALQELWDANEDDGRNFIFNALLQTKLDASVEFIKQALNWDVETYKVPAFNYLTLTDFIFKPGVYEAVRDFARDYDREHPKQKLLQLVITNASSVLKKFDEDKQIEILLDNLRFPDMGMMRFGLQNIIQSYGDKGLRAFTTEYISLNDQIRKEAVNQIIYKYKEKPESADFVSFLKLVVQKDSIEDRYKALTALADPVILNFDPSVYSFLLEVLASEPTQTQGKMKTIIENGYVKYLIGKKFDDDAKLELVRLVKSGSVDAAISSFNYLKQELDEREFSTLLDKFKADFDKYSPNNKCVLLDKFAREFTENDAKEFLLKSLKDANFKVRTVAFERLILNPKFAKDEQILNTLNDARDKEKDPVTKQHFYRTLLLNKIRTEIFKGFSKELLANIDEALGSNDEQLIKQTIEIVHGFENPELLQILVKHFDNFPQNQRVHVADFMTRYKDIDFAWVQKTAKAESVAVRQALFFALIGRLKEFKEDKVRKLCKEMIENEDAQPIKERFEKSLAEVK